MTQTAKMSLTAAAAALLAAGVTLTTTASGWTLPGFGKAPAAAAKTSST